MEEPCNKQCTAGSGRVERLAQQRGGHSPQGNDAASNEPLTWLALAAGWSSGTFAPTPLPIPAYMTGRGVRIALQISGRIASLPERPSRLQACVAEGMRLAKSES